MAGPESPNLFYEGEHLDQQPDPLSVEEALAKFTPLVEQMRAEAKPYSLQEYLALAAQQGLEALKKGNYGIGALYVVRQGGWEVVIAGQNGIKSERDTSKHAEMDAIDWFEAAMREEDIDERVIVSRPAPDGSKDARILITSLEPCGMCTTRSVTHYLDGGLGIGSPDLLGGAVLKDREENVPERIQTLRRDQGLQIFIPNYEDPQSEYYVDPKFAHIGLDIFSATRVAIDDQIAQGAVVDLSNLPAFVDKYRETRRG